MSAPDTSRLKIELQGGVESAIFGLSITIGPILLFTGFFGRFSLAAAFWATLVTALVPPAARILLRGHPSVLSSTRAASLAAYASLVYQMGTSIGYPSTHGAGLTEQQLVIGLAMGSLMYAAASALIMATGLLKLGNIFKMIPSPVTAGISNSTALLLVWLARIFHATPQHDPVRVNFGASDA